VGLEQRFEQQADEVDRIVLVCADLRSGPGVEARGDARLRSSCWRIASASEPAPASARAYGLRVPSRCSNEVTLMTSAARRSRRGAVCGPGVAAAGTGGRNGPFSPGVQHGRRSPKRSIASISREIGIRRRRRTGLSIGLTGVAGAGA
jgi:hypothetical protein